jgi:RNA recognition motif-containing protein
MYVSNLSFHTTVEDLKNLFTAFGEVTSAKVIIDKLTNRSRGFGFVEMASEEQGNAAITGLNNKEIEGRFLSVSIAREREDRSNSGAFSRGSNGNKIW